MNIEKEYERWCNTPLEDNDLKEELVAIKDNIDEINDRFYRSLEFATAGLRGVIGAGTNRMNIYTVRQATQGYADYINISSDAPRAVIAYDSRIKSEIFAKEAAKVLAANGIKTFIFKELEPTPLLSYAVRELKCEGGINITASHNPSKYNGYKAYGRDGSQISPEAADKIFQAISDTDIFTGVLVSDFDGQVKLGMIEYVDDALIEKYLNEVLKASEYADICKKANIKVCYTPLNGAGNKCVRKILNTIGVSDIIVVPEQEKPDGNFPTCPYPNPEEKEALSLGLLLAEKSGADLLLATDPDSDRVGIAVRTANGFKLMTGNEVGALLLYYIASAKTEKNTMPLNPIAVKSIVSTELAKAICDDFGIKLIDVLTGFKFIGEQITLLEQKNEDNRFIFGFEESYGYLAGVHARDKDAVVASMLICEMTAFYKLKGKTLYEQMNYLYKKYGFFTHRTKSMTFEGESGMLKMKSIMDNIRKNPVTEIAGFKVICEKDYQQQTITDKITGEVSDTGLPKTNAVTFILKNGSSVVIRPSGTEPKIKFYYTAVCDSSEKSDELIEKLGKDVNHILVY